jgi:hypothetical protein
VLAATTSAQVAADLADLVNVILAHRMDDAAAARRLSAVADAAGPAGQGRPPDPGEVANPGSGPATDMGDVSSLRDGEFLLMVKNPRRFVPRGLLVRARVPPFTRDGRPAAPRRAWEGT